MNTPPLSKAVKFRLADKQKQSVRNCVANYNHVPAATQGRRIILGFVGACSLFMAIFALLGAWMPATALGSFLAIHAITHWLFHGINGRSPLYDTVLDFTGRMGRGHWMVALAAFGVLIILLILTSLLAAAVVLVVLAMALVGGIYFLFDRKAEEQRHRPLDEIRRLLDVLRRNGVNEHEQRRIICVHGGDDWEPCFESLFGYEALLEARRAWPDDTLGRRRPRRGQLRDWAIRHLAVAGEGLAECRATTEPAKQTPPPPPPEPDSDAAVNAPVAAAPPRISTDDEGHAPSVARIERLQRRIALSLEKATRRRRFAWLTLRRTRCTAGAVLVGLCSAWIIQNKLVSSDDLASVGETVTTMETVDALSNEAVVAIENLRQGEEKSMPLQVPVIPTRFTDPVLRPISGWRTGLAGAMLILCCCLPLPGLATSSYLAAAVMMFADHWGMPEGGPLGADGWAVVAGVALLGVGVFLATLQRSAAAVLPSGTAPWRDMQLLNARGQVVHDRDRRHGAEGEMAIRYLKAVLAAAQRVRASDIHFEPESTIRLRVDGSMIEVAQLEQGLFARLLNLVKILCDLDIAKPGTVQDGSFQATLHDRPIDFRSSFAPVAGHQKLVVRVLDAEAVPQSLEELRMPPSIDDQVRALCARDSGMLLVCGPTGSGKTTTLYAALRTVDVTKRNVITIEDPVEYHLGGITQTSVNKDAGNSFSHLLRSSLRQDPDVMLVGEIRDGDTATTALRAAMTGHLVLSTMHANDAVSTLVRLMDLGADANLLASSLRVIVVQRLIRTLCPHCKVRRRPDPPVVTSEGIPLPHVFEPQSCRQCLGTGFRGRRALFEMLVLDDAMKQVIQQTSALGDLQRAAEAAGLLSMSQTAWHMVAEGVTSVSEIDRVLGG